LRASVAKHRKRSQIYVLAGVNGAGKSSVGGAMFAKVGQEFFNPDVAAREARLEFPEIDQEEANAKAWQAGRQFLEAAIADRRDFAFETTLGGNTMTELLGRAADAGIDVHIWYVGLETVELHIERVRFRVVQGGHDIPELKIRQRYDRSRLNLLRLLPRLTELRLFDNTAERDEQAHQWPEPKLLLYWRRGRILSSYDLLQMPEWAKPILQTAMELSPKALSRPTSGTGATHIECHVSNNPESALRTR
jgi:predicted ABC-type ATPase